MPKAPLALDDLPKLSPWPEILLGLKPFAQKQRTREIILREYDHDKWGHALKGMQGRTKISRAEVLAIHGDPKQKIAISIGEKLFAARRGKTLEAYVRWIIRNLQHYKGQALVELGSGVGEKLLSAAQALRPPAVYGGEFTASGVGCGQLLAKAWGIQAIFGHFDFNQPATLEAVPTGAVVYTAHAIEQIPQLSRDFIEALLRRQPRVVLHFEPCLQDHDSGDILDLFRKRYVETNDYNRNLLALLRDFEAEGKIRILEHRASVFGINPLNPTSLVVWAPANRARGL